MVIDTSNCDVLRSPSRLWAEAYGLERKGIRWAHNNTTCVMCGQEVRRGDMSEPAGIKLFNVSFNNKPDVKYRGHAVCGHCMAVWDKPWMQAKSKSYAVQGQGVFRLGRNLDIARFVLDPPKAPYVAIFNTRQQQHMVWRSTVAMPNPNQVIVRIDDEVGVIDTARVRAGIRAWRTSTVIAAELGKPSWTPFHAGKNITNDAFVGRPREYVCAALAKHSDAARAAIATLGNLTVYEWWATFASRAVDVDQPDSWPPRVDVDEEAEE